MALSTDIGSIEVQGPVNGPVRADTRVDGEGIGNAITGVINEGRVNKFNTALDEVKADVFSTEGGDSGGRIAPVTGDPDADSLLENIYALEDGMSQSSGSRKSALALQLRQVYDTFAKKHPRLRGRLAQELTRFESTDPEIAALDLVSQEDSAVAALAAKDLERLKDEAYNKLGMSPGIEKFGSIGFAREFARRNRAVQTKIVNDQILEAQESNQDLKVSDYLDTFQAGMSGEASDTTETWMQYGEDLSTFQIALSDVTQPGAKETIQFFNNGQKQALAAKVQGNIYSAQRRFNAIPIKYADQDQYKAARAVLDSHVQMLSGFLEGIQTDNPTLIKAYETYATAQMIGFEAENRDVVQLNRQVRAFKDTLELVDKTFGGEGAIIQHELGQISIQSLEAMVGKDLALSSGLPKTARDGLPPTANSRRQEYSAMAQGVLDITGNNAQTQQERQKFLIEEEVIKNEAEYMRLAGDGVLAPQRALALIEAKGVRMVALNQSGPLDWTGQKTVLESYADPAILNAAILAGQVDPTANEVLAQDLGRIATNYDSTRVNNYIDTLNTKVHGQLLGESTFVTGLIKADFSDIDNGNVTFTYDNAALHARIREVEGAAPAHVIKIAQNRMNEATRELSRIVSKDLKWLAHVEALHNGTNEADYATQYDLSFSEMRIPREDGQSKTN